jgi:hypothetical protein
MIIEYIFFGVNCKYVMCKRLRKKIDFRLKRFTKMMDDDHYKLFSEFNKKYNFLLNEKNNQKNDGFLVVEIVPKEQDIAGIYLLKQAVKFILVRYMEDG